LSEAILEPDLSLPFPVEFLIQDTPLSHQGKNANAKERWKRKVGEAAKARVDALKDFFFLDDRALAATIFYFPSAAMDGDVDKIVKLILDGMIAVIYPDDRLLERITVQKFEPETDTVLRSLTPTLKQATEMERPVVYIRIDDDLRWRVLP
jgi:Holliday junction resolvase RusA-like endonuclease